MEKTNEQPVGCREAFERWAEDNLPAYNAANNDSDFDIVLRIRGAAILAWQGAWNARPTTRESGWVDYPANTPEQSYPSIPLSHPLLFVNVDEGKTYIRLGYFDNEDGCFYESGDEKKLPWVHTVTKFFMFPYPETAKSNESKGGK